MTYIFEVTGNCPHKTSPLNIGGNALDVNSLTATCSVCGVAATINHGQAIGLERADPGFENRVEELAEGFSTLSYYLATVTDGKIALEIRFRKTITRGIGVFCKTCNKGIPVDENLRLTLKQDHNGHDVQIGIAGDAPVTGKLLEMFRAAMEQMLGEPVAIEQPK